MNKVEHHDTALKHDMIKQGETEKNCCFTDSIKKQLLDWHAFDISRVSDQNGVSLLYITLEIHHSVREPSIYEQICFKLCVIVGLVEFCILIVV